MAKQKKKTSSKTGVHSVTKTKSGQIVIQDNVDKFIEEFLKNGGNATKAALAVGNYSTLASAQMAGSRYLTKAKERGLVRNVLEKKGYDYGKMMDVALEKMEKSKKPDWWDRIMKMADYEDFVSGKAGGGTNVSVNIPFFAAHRKLSEEYIEGEEVVEGETEKEPAHDEDKL